MYYLVYGNGNPFKVVYRLGFPTLADRMAASTYDAWSSHRRFMPIWVWDAADHFVFSVRHYVPCSECFHVLWQPHAFVGHHDNCHKQMLAREVLDAKIREDLADDVLFQLEMSGLTNQASIAIMTDVSFREWLWERFPDLRNEIRVLVLKKFRARALG